MNQEPEQELTDREEADAIYEQRDEWADDLDEED
jgi:hypothetical protein